MPLINPVDASNAADLPDLIQEISRFYSPSGHLDRNLSLNLIQTILTLLLDELHSAQSAIPILEARIYTLEARLDA